MASGVTAVAGEVMLPVAGLAAGVLAFVSSKVQVTEVAPSRLNSTRRDDRLTSRSPDSQATFASVHSPASTLSLIS